MSGHLPLFLKYLSPWPSDKSLGTLQKCLLSEALTQDCLSLTTWQLIYPSAFHQTSDSYCYCYYLLTLVTWCEELTHLKRPWCWERLKAKGEGGDRGWDVGCCHPLTGHERGQAPGDSGDRGAWRAAVHRVTESWARLSDWTLIIVRLLLLFLFAIQHKVGAH